MMSAKLPAGLLRVNSLSIEQFGQLNACFQAAPADAVRQLLACQPLNVAIRYAAESFWLRLQQKQANQTLTGKDLLTLKKYLLRATFRATPFGLFAAVGQLQHGTSTQLLITPANFDCVQNAVSPIQPLHPANYQLNPTVYIDNNGHLRYQQRHWRDGKADDSLCQIEGEPALHLLLTRLPVTFTAAEFLSIVAGVYPDSSVTEQQDYLAELVEAGVLLQQAPSTSPPADCQVTPLQQWQPSAASTVPCFVNLRVQPVKATLQTSLLQRLNRDLALLDSVCPRSQQQGLLSFRQDFLQRYEDAAVPLLEVLDPMTGLGGFGHSVIRSELLAGAGLQPKQTGHFVQQVGSQLDEWLVQQATRADRPAIIDLAQWPDWATYKSAPTVPLCSSYGCLIKLFDHQQQTLIHFQGSFGPTANSWQTRFAHLFADEFHDAMQTLADREISANPDVIFAEVVTLEDIKHRNLVCRPQLYPYQIPLFTAPAEGFSSASLLHPADLLVYLQHDEICLYSRRLGKRVIPRITSAHAHQHQQLGLYQFFGAIQQQSERSPRFITPALFNYLSYLPRLQYRNIIIQPKRWLLGKTVVETLLKQAPAERRSTLSTLQLDQFVCAGAADHILRYDLLDELDLQLLLTESANQLELYESLADQYVSPVIGQDGEHYHHEIVAILLPESPAHRQRPAPAVMSRRTCSTIRSGEHGIYLKVYAPLHLQDDLLLTLAKLPLCQTPAGQSMFFVRYDSPRPHLRLRWLTPAPLADSYQIDHLLTVIRQSCAAITEIEVADYKREINRYGGLPAMLLAERIFSIDSQLVLQTLAAQQPATESDRLRLAVQVLQVVMQAMSLDLPQQVSFCYQQFNGYLREYQSSAAILHRLTAQYRQHGAALRQLMQDQSQRPWQLHEMAGQLQHYVAILQAEATPLAPALTSIFHMHCNRLFLTYNRALEMLVYGLAYKTLASLAAMSSPAEEASALC